MRYWRGAAQTPDSSHGAHQQAQINATLIFVIRNPQRFLCSVVLANYRLFLQMRTKKNSIDWFFIFPYVRNDNVIIVEDFGIPFFANRQFFLKFSKICKKIDFEAFFMHISLYGANRENTAKISSERYLYG